MECHAEDLARTPETHTGPPGSGATADNNGHAPNLIAPRKQRVVSLNQIAERPYLSSMGMTAQHQINTDARSPVGLQRSVGEKDSSSRWSPVKRLQDGVAAPSRTSPDSEIVHTGQNKTGMKLDP